MGQKKLSLIFFLFWSWSWPPTKNWPTFEGRSPSRTCTDERKKVNKLPKSLNLWILQLSFSIFMWHVMPVICNEIWHVKTCELSWHLTYDMSWYVTYDHVTHDLSWYVTCHDIWLVMTCHDMWNIMKYRYIWHVTNLTCHDMWHVMKYVFLWDVSCDM